MVVGKVDLSLSTSTLMDTFYFVIIEFQLYILKSGFDTTLNETNQQVYKLHLQGLYTYYVILQFSTKYFHLFRKYEKLCVKDTKYGFEISTIPNSTYSISFRNLSLYCRYREQHPISRKYENDQVKCTMKLIMLQNVSGKLCKSVVKHMLIEGKFVSFMHIVWKCSSNS